MLFFETATARLGIHFYLDKQGECDIFLFHEM
jgi:hypothetical protein